MNRSFPFRKVRSPRLPTRAARAHLLNQEMHFPRFCRFKPMDFFPSPLPLPCAFPLAAFRREPSSWLKPMMSVWFIVWRTLRCWKAPSRLDLQALPAKAGGFFLLFFPASSGETNWNASVSRFKYSLNNGNRSVESNPNKLHILPFGYLLKRAVPTRII